MKQAGEVFELKPHHVAINVPHIDAAITWYGDVLGFAVEKRNFVRGDRGQNALLKHGDSRIELFEHEKISPGDGSPRTEMEGSRTEAEAQGQSRPGYPAGCHAHEVPS